MANLENLNFAVILDDSKFNAQIVKVQEAADKFNATMTDALKLTGITGGAANAKKLADAIKEATKAQLDFNKAVKDSPAEKVTIRHASAVSATNDKLFNTARLLRTIGTLTGGAFSVYGIRRFLSTLIDVTGQFEVQKMALRTMLQDIDAADKIFQDLYRFSSDSTYRFSELAKYSKQLAAFNIGKDSLLETTKMLGDVASGVGVSMDRIILAYGHVKSSGFLRGIQLRSFSQNGVPILDELAKMFTELEGHAVSLGDVFDKMTKREIPFEMVEEAFKRMTSEGGKFYKMQEVLSKTLAGQMNILKGRWENLMYAIGQSQEGLLKGTVSKISNLIADYDRFGKTIKELIGWYTAYKAAQLIIIGITDAAAFANLRLVKTFKSLTAALATNPWTLLTAAVVAAGYAIYKAETALSDVEKIQNSVTKSVNDFNKATDSEIGELDALYTKLKLAQEGTEEYDSTKKAIQSRFGTYIDELRGEGVEVNNLAGIYMNLADKIRDANKERFLESSMSDLGKTWGDIQTDIDKEFGKIVSGIEKDLGRSLTQLERQALDRSVKGNIAEGTEEVVANAIAGIYGALQGGQKNTRNSGVWGQAHATSQKPVANYEGQLQALTRRYSTAMTEYADSVTELNDAFETLNKSVSTSNTQQESLSYKIPLIVDNLKRLDRQIDTIRDKAKKGEITVAEKEELDKLVSQREEDAKLYKEIMGSDYDKSTTASARAFDSAVKKRISALNKEASVLRKYKDVYDTLRPHLGDAQTTSALETLFGRKFEDTDFETQLDRLIVKLSELGEEGQQAAESLRASLGKETAQELAKALEAQDKAAEMLSEYLEKDFGIEGEGVAAKISKVLRDLTNQNLKVDKGLGKFIDELDKSEYIEKLLYSIKQQSWWDEIGFSKEERDALADDYWKEWRAKMIESWKERMKLEKEANKKLSTEKIVEFADDYFKQFTNNIDLTNLNDQTIAQLLANRAKLMSMSLPTDIVNQLSDDELERFSEVLDKLQGDALQKFNLVITDKKAQSARKLASAFSGIGDALVEMGEAMNNDLLVGMGKVLSFGEEIVNTLMENDTLMLGLVDDTGELVKNVDDLTKSADWITMIVKLVLIVVKQIASAAADSTARLEALREAALEARDMLYDQKLTDGVESIFGKNLVRQIQNAKNEIAELNEAMKETTLLNKYGATGGIGNAADRMAAYRNTMLTDTAWYRPDKTFSLMDAIEELGYKPEQIFDAYGNVRKEILEAIRDTYNLNKASKEWIDNQIQYVEKYANAMAVVEDAMESVFGDVAQSAADAIIDEWLQAGDAALDYADILDDVAKSYAKMVIQSTILDQVFDTAHIKALAEQFMSGDYENAMSTIAEDMQKIADMEPVFAQILGAFDPYFNKEGTENTLANGIKGITEDTANLLASYLNAIRADVSTMRALAQSGWATVDNIAASLTVLPTLNDYMAQIEAHNANIEQNTHQILLELQSVIVNEGSGRGFRSYIS